MFQLEVFKAHLYIKINYTASSPSLPPSPLSLYIYILFFASFCLVLVGGNYLMKVFSVPNWWCFYIFTSNISAVSQNPEAVLDPLRQASEELQVLEVTSLPSMCMWILGISFIGENWVFLSEYWINLHGTLKHC